jgi:hypothetical protein
VPSSIADGTVVLHKDLTWNSPGANLVVSANHTLNLATHSLKLAGAFSVAANGGTFKHLIMTSPDAVLDVGGLMHVQGENTLSAGTIVLRGGFSQSFRATAFQPSGTLVAFDGPGQAVNFADAINSFFRNADIRAGASVNFSTNGRMLGNLDLDGSIFVPAGRTVNVLGTLFFAGGITNNGVMTAGTCVDEGGTFAGTGNNPCP